MGFFSENKSFLRQNCVCKLAKIGGQHYMKEVLVAKLQMELQYGIDAFHSGLEFSF